MQNCTIRKQAELMQVQPKGTPALPPRVVALRKSGTGQKIFWAHYLNADLANLIGDDQSFFSSVSPQRTSYLWVGHRRCRILLLAS
jgi:hypothetical protein